MKNSYASILITMAVLAAGCSSARDRRTTSITRADPVTPPYPALTVQTDSDRALEMVVRQQFERYGALSTLGQNIQILAQDGTVTLNGSVPTEQERQMIVSMVENTRGVLAVDDRLDVPGVATYPFNQSDRVIASSIRQALQLQPDLAASAPGITVNVDKGIVSLGGKVATEADRQAIEAIARGRSGVIGVVNHLETRMPTGRPFADLGGLYSLRVQGLTEGDRPLAQKVLQGIQSDTVLSALFPSVNIEASGGKVTLKGSVQSDLQRRTIVAAAERAAGAENVIDQLQVQPPR